MEVADVAVPVALGDAQVRGPGDIVVGDDDGVVVVASRAAEVLNAAEQIGHAEDQIQAAVRSGLTIGHARAEFGYHQLQRK